jgi:hypothetical protein
VEEVREEGKEVRGQPQPSHKLLVLLTLSCNPILVFCECNVINKNYSQIAVVEMKLEAYSNASSFKE